MKKILPFFIIIFSIIYLQSRPIPKTNPSNKFDKIRALGDLAYQVNLGPRTPKSEAHAKTIQYINEQLKDAGWLVENQQQDISGIKITNIIGNWGNLTPWILIGAHYDSRIFANRDSNPVNRTKPVPGANDGASGVAVILELARIIPNYHQTWANKISLVLFDAEDNGDINGWEWIMGSQYYVTQLKSYPDYVVIIDMIGDSKLNIYYEANSDLNLSTTIWNNAAELGYSSIFIPKLKYRIIDDQIPFVRIGIPTAEIIDFDYPYWHTTQDTLDKISSTSLNIIGDTLIAWIDNKESGKKLENPR